MSTTKERQAKTVDDVGGGCWPGHVMARTGIWKTKAVRVDLTPHGDRQGGQRLASGPRGKARHGM